MPVYPGDLMMAWALESVRCGNQETLVGLCESADMVGGNAALWVFGFAGLGKPPLVACRVDFFVGQKEEDISFIFLL